MANNDRPRDWLGHKPLTRGALQDGCCLGLVLVGSVGVAVLVGLWIHSLL